MRSRRRTGWSPLGAAAAFVVLAAAASTIAWGLEALSLRESARHAPRMAPPGSSVQSPRSGGHGGRRHAAGAAADPVRAAFERGVAAYNTDDAEGAADAFEEAVRLAPNDPEAHINLGLVYLRLQRSDDAMRELTLGASLTRKRDER